MHFKNFILGRQNMDSSVRSLKIAIIQTESKHGAIDDNLNRAGKLIEQAAKEGAKLIVLPELFACGYIPNPSLWQYGETGESKTIRWLKYNSQRLKIFLGAGLVEIIDRDYFNTFVLANPEGKIEGRAVKNDAESYCFKRGKGLHIIDSSIGRIGVGICADNHFTRFIRQMQSEKIDFLLMPHAWPSPDNYSQAVSQDDVKHTKADIQGFASLVNGLLGVPCIFANQIGSIAPMSGILGKMMNPNIFKLRGCSKIIDAGGSVLAELSDKEGFAAATISLDSARRNTGAVPDYRGWIHPGNFIIRKIIIPIDIFMGSLVYTLSGKRKKEMKRILASSGEIEN